MGKSAYQEKLTEAMGGELLLTPGVAAIVRNEQGWILVEQRADNGRWDLPGGSAEPGETPMEGLRREVREETGLEVSVAGVAGVFGGPAFRHTYEDGQEVEAFTVVLDCTVTGGALRGADGEATRFRYVSVDDLPPLMWPYPTDLFRSGRAHAVVL